MRWTRAARHLSASSSASHRRSGLSPNLRRSLCLGDVLGKPLKEAPDMAHLRASIINAAQVVAAVSKVTPDAIVEAARLSQCPIIESQGRFPLEAGGPLL